VFLQQTAEKYLKGYLIASGWKLVKTHDLKLLVDEAKKHDGNFERFYDLADRLTKHYIDEKYPPVAAELTVEEAKALCTQAEELIKLVAI
jgi:HEPN domain-containing protein